MSHAEAHAEHSPYLQHHWDSLDQQFEAGKLGMWLFLATEILLFGGLFCAYTIWRFHHPEMFKFGSTFLDTKMGAINTAVLIASSLTMAVGVTMAQMNKQRELLICLVLTLMGAFGFLVIKYFEYSHKFHEGYFPGIRFYERPGDGAHSWQPGEPVAGLGISAIDPTSTALTVEELGLPDDIVVELSTVGPAAEAPGGLDPAVLGEWETAREKGKAEEAAHDESHGEHHGPIHPLQDPERPVDAHMFFNIYFMMTGLHGVHVIIGAIVIIWLIWKVMRGQINDEYFTPIDLGGLYWHVVDLIWIFLFPLFYLI